MKEPMEIAMSFVAEADRFFFEHREKGRANGALGKIGCWGGQLQAGETARQAVYREVTQEEVRGLGGFRPEDFRPLGHEPLEVESDRDGQPLRIRAHVFQLLLPFGYGDRLQAPNSAWLNLTDLQAALSAGKLTPATERAVVDCLGMEKQGED